MATVTDALLRSQASATVYSENDKLFELSIRSQSLYCLSKAEMANLRLGEQQ